MKKEKDLEQRKNLHQYYKKVFRCKLCRKLYGIDIGKEDSKGICPPCSSPNNLRYIDSERLKSRERTSKRQEKVITNFCDHINKVNSVIKGGG